MGLVLAIGNWTRSDEPAPPSKAAPPGRSAAGEAARETPRPAAKPAKEKTAGPGMQKAEEDDEDETTGPEVAKPTEKKTAEPEDAGPTERKTAGREIAKPAKERTAGPAAAAAQPKPEKLRFQFHFQPWKDVLEWFAEQADLSLIMDSAPQGTFNYNDRREYTPAEAIDLLNSVLSTKGYMLVRRERLLMLVNLEDGIPPNLVPTVAPEALDSKGEFELVSVLFDLEKIKPEEAEAEVKKLLGPQGTVVALSKSRQVLVTETAGRLRAIRSVFKRIESESDRQGPQVEVIRLSRVDPQLAVASINKLFSSPPDVKPAAGTQAAPQVDADPASRQLMIRGTEAQIAQIRSLLEKMGEHFAPHGGASHSGHVRLLPLSSPVARSTLERIEEVWPGMRSNPIRVLTPSAAAPKAGPDEQRPPEAIPPALLPRLREGGGPVQPAKPSAAPGEKAHPPAAPEAPPPPPLAPRPATQKPAPAAERSTRLAFGARLIEVAEVLPGQGSAQPKPPAPIFVIPGPEGLTITSEDTEALDEFEQLAGTLAEEASGMESPITVFYLKHAKATAVVETLDQVFIGGLAVSGPSPPGVPPAAGGSSDSGGSVGALGRVGSRRRPMATGPVKITPDDRLNALLVQANRTDLASLEQLLKILDQKGSPEDLSISPKPRMIPVQHTRAQDVADIIKQVYADRMVESPSAMANRQPPMPFFMRGLMQQPNQPKRDDATRLSVGVDTRTNSLVVAATDPLFEEVKQLVSQLDLAAADGQGQTVRVVTLHRTSLSTVERALAAIAGDSVQVNRNGSPAGETGSQQFGQNAPWQQRFQRRANGGPNAGGPGQQPGQGPGFNPPDFGGRRFRQPGDGSGFNPPDYGGRRFRQFPQPYQGGPP
jgi:type II secretory pathway component GspD/PulD (secretin)